MRATASRAPGGINSESESAHVLFGLVPDARELLQEHRRSGATQTTITIRIAATKGSSLAYINTGPVSFINTRMVWRICTRKEFVSTKSEIVLEATNRFLSVQLVDVE